MAACRGFFECLLRLLNFILTVAGLAMVGYGIYLLVEWMKISEDGSSGGLTAEVLVSGRPLLGAVALGDSFLDMLPKAWFIYLFIGVGATVFLVSLFGCIGAGTRNTCCLCFVIPVDKTHNFDVMYGFLKKNWEIARWVALGVVVFEYGLDTSQFTYNPSDPSRYQQNGAPQAEERSRCTIM
ncbi:Tobamovirus multiplication protein 2A [Zea mays]|uniref:Tobamovirus multiplication protein 2A n=1 Tax=Zea mays TaxID=4577 RepID=A0A1D6K8Y0_MAIZE|nr:Tobamovirus multiplication protein 2A [Zea mays]